MWFNSNVTSKKEMDLMLSMQKQILENELDIIVTTNKDVVGINFFDLCIDVVTEPFKNYHDKEQVCGRAERANVLKPRRVTIIHDHDKPFDP